MKMVPFFTALVCSAVLAVALSLASGREAAAQPLRLAIARLTHDHVHWAFQQPERTDIRIVGIYEPDPALVARYAAQYGLDRDLFYDSLEDLLDTEAPEAVAAFGSIREHLSVVEASAPRGIHVMVEKPLAVSLEHALAIEALARRHGIHVLTNYETTWYPSTHAAYRLVHGDEAIGEIRKVVVHDGHQGPKEIGVSSEFLEWLTDPVQNGGGALIDFGCYGANLITWLMQGALPTSVTAVTQQIKPEVYPKVEDEATILLTYPEAQGIIQASWNWPFSRKDMEIYGQTGYVMAPDRNALRVRAGREQTGQVRDLERQALEAEDPFAYLAAVVRGRIEPAPTDLSALENNVTVVRILEAAKESARTGRTVSISPR